MTELSRERVVLLLSGVFVAGFLATTVYGGYFGAFAQPVIEKIEQRTEPNFVPLTWEMATSPAPFPKRDAHATIEFHDKLWLIGGLNGEPARVRPEYIEYWRATHLSDIWLSTDAREWTLVTNNTPWGGERSLELEVFHDALWLFGGWSPVGGYSTHYWKTTDGEHWEKVITTTAPPAREGAPIVTFKDRLWMFGGVNFDTRKDLNDVWSSADGITWEQATSTIPWAGRYDHAVSAYNGKLWLTGGVQLGGKILDDEWMSSDGSHWEQVTPNDARATARHGHVMIEWKDALWMFGGWTDPITGDGESWFTKDGTNWTKANIGAWKQREDLSVSIFHDQPVLTGGMDVDWHWNNDVWIGRLP